MEPAYTRALFEKAVKSLQRNKHFSCQTSAMQKSVTLHFHCNKLKKDLVIALLPFIWL